MNQLELQPYRIENPEEIFSPGLVIYRQLVEQNLHRMIEVAGDVQRLRPHCKTHKMARIVEMQRELGIFKHKCATVAEAEMLASAGIRDVFLAYNPVGPCVRRVVALAGLFPGLTLSVTADHPAPVAELGAAATAAGVEIEVLLDVDSGLHRTGVPAAAELAAEVYRDIERQPHLRPGGLHLYDGQNHQTDVDERRTAVRAVWQQGAALRDRLQDLGWPVPRIVAGGTGSFPLFAEIDDPAVELSPGTIVLHDAGYGRIFPDLDFTPAALILTRVISRPSADRLTLDLGNKAVASDPPAGKRLFFPDLPDAVERIHNEEHLVLETDQAQRYQPGDALLAIPVHICPTSALHRQVYVVEHNRVVTRWEVTARDRQLTV